MILWAIGTCNLVRVDVDVPCDFEDLVDLKVYYEIIWPLFLFGVRLLLSLIRREGRYGEYLLDFYLLITNLL